MFCPKCGVRLSDSETRCPLCLLELPHIPSLSKNKPLYPKKKRPRDKGEFSGFLFALTLLFLAVGGSGLAADLTYRGEVTFSGYLWFGLAFFYAVFILPRWFVKPNPVILFPIAFLIFSGALLYLNLALGTFWYWSFALPVTGGVFLFIEIVLTLIHYLRRGRYYIFGSYFLVLGIFSFVTEILFRAVFDLPIRLTWSLIPLIFFCVLGLGLLTVAIVPPLKRYFEKRFFL